jgi:hypothetical protein
MNYTPGYFSHLILFFLAFSATGSLNSSSPILKERDSIIQPYMKFLSSQTMLANDVHFPTNLIDQVPLLRPQDQYYLCVNIIKEYAMMVLWDPVTDRDLSIDLIYKTDFGEVPSIATIRKNQETINQFALAALRNISDSVKTAIFNSFDSLQLLDCYRLLQDTLFSWKTDWIINGKAEDCGFRPAATLNALLLSIGPLSSNLQKCFSNYDSIPKPQLIIPMVSDTTPFVDRFESMRKTPLLKGTFGYMWQTGLNGSVKLAGKWQAHIPVICLDLEKKKAYPATTFSSFLFYENGSEDQPTILTVIKPNVVANEFSVALFMDSCTVSFPQCKKVDQETLNEFWENQTIDQNLVEHPIPVRGVFFDILKHNTNATQVSHYFALKAEINGTSYSEIHIYQISAKGNVDVPITDCERIENVY